MASVTLSRLSKTYPGDVLAVDAVDLEVADGEFVVLVGPSGCGKSTTLRMVAGLEEISSGELRIGEGVVNEVPAKDRDIAMVFQNYALYPHLTVRRNLSFGLDRRRTHGRWLPALVSSGYRAEARREDAAIRERVERAAGLLGIGDLLDRKPGELSGGQRQRVAVGRALVREPEVFLFDEPLSNLDARLRLEMRSELKALHRATGATVIYVTHDQEEAMTLGDRLVVMKDGVVQQCGTPAEVYARPANRFVAGFVGTPPMNFVEGRVAGGGATLEVEGEGWTLGGGRGVDDGPVALGLRPDRLAPREGDGPSLAVAVELVEDLGDRWDVVSRTEGGTRLVSRIEPTAAVREGEAVRLGVDLEEAHLFEAGPEGRRLG